MWATLVWVLITPLEAKLPFYPTKASDLSKWIKEDEGHEQEWFALRNEE
jgi:hypothetical protein